MGKNYKLIAITAMAISVIGIISCLFSFYGVWKGASQFNTVPDIFQILFSFTTLNLSFTNKFEHSDIWNFIFYVLLFIGGLQFIRTKGKETRFVGFVFSVIFLEAIILLLQSTFYKVFIIQWENITSKQVFYLMLSYVVLFGVLYLSFRILKIIKSEKEIDIIKTEAKTTVTDTGKWQRFFHWIVDATIMALILIPFVISLGYWLMESDVLRESEGLRMFFRSRWSLYVIVFAFFFIYYPVSEILFGSTPAKFLTESRVVNSKAESPGSSVVFLRTLCRNIPFDALSFFAKRGWHDSLSETYVVKEKRTGFKTNKLLWILPVLAIYLAVMYFGKRYYSEYTSHREMEDRMSEKLKFLESEIKNPNPGQFFVVNDIDYYGDIDNYGFKIEKVEGNKITIKRIMGEFLSESNFSQAKYLYQQQKDSAKTFVIRKDEFVKMFPKNQEEFYRPSVTMEFFEPGIRYNIENVYNFNIPFLEAQISNTTNDYSDRKATVYFTNHGASGTITNIKNIEGDMKWKTGFPVIISNQINSPAMIDVENFDLSGENVSQIDVLDSLKQKHTYIFKNRGFQTEITKVK
ncbi:RDD family protein [Chryseobacterium sp. RLHN22]|uniref:RDD family protein n=1 Tax=Chryseobacterium sp. RLHN22 TaxID=3437885 RepID=UPI003D9BE51E